MVVEKHFSIFKAALETVCTETRNAAHCIQINRMLFIEMDFTEEQFQIVF